MRVYISICAVEEQISKPINQEKKEQAGQTRKGDDSYLEEEMSYAGRPCNREVPADGREKLLLKSLMLYMMMPLCS